MHQHRLFVLFHPEKWGCSAKSCNKGSRNRYPVRNVEKIDVTPEIRILVDRHTEKHLRPVQVAIWNLENLKIRFFFGHTVAAEPENHATHLESIEKIPGRPAGPPGIDRIPDKKKRVGGI